MSKANKKLINGILLVNKPSGMTSNAVLQKVKWHYQARKAGHTGSLDPLATGMLPICFGEATKFSQYLLDADKCYEVTAQLGIKTNTADAMGEIIAEVDNISISQMQLNEVVQQFIGKTEQVPSMFSALKHQGQPLYKLARAGMEVERKAREINIESIVVNDFNGQIFNLTVKCSKGTYIRNLVEDIGDRLGVGAHVTKLHRLYTAGFENDSMYSLDEILAKEYLDLLDCLLPMERAIHWIPKQFISLEISERIQAGLVIQDFHGCATGLVRLYVKEEFIGLGEITRDAELKAKRLLSRE